MCTLAAELKRAIFPTCWFVAILFWLLRFGSFFLSLQAQSLKLLIKIEEAERKCPPMPKTTIVAVEQSEITVLINRLRRRQILLQSKIERLWQLLKKLSG